MTAVRFQFAINLLRPMVVAVMAFASSDLALGLEARTNALNHWAFEPVTRPPVPRITTGSVRTPVDSFVLQQLQKRNLTPSPEADRAALIRRLYFDLVGLPPSPSETAAFVEDPRPDAYEQLVERLLASPQYGERWGRHWLDTAGYADSNGYFDADSDRPLAWKYRDYVVRSLTLDKPFDQFICEQIAGDELAGFEANGDVTGETEELLVATHFLRNAPDGTGESDGNAMELKVDRYSVLEGTVHLLGSVFMGMTVQCARCHDHKFEPFTQREYYQLQAILRPAYDPDHWLKPKDRLVSIGSRTERENRQKAIDSADREIKATRESIDGLLKPFRRVILQENLRPLPAGERTKIEKALETKDKDRNKEMKDLLKKHEKLVEIKDEAVTKRFPELAEGLRNLENSLKKREAGRPVPLPQISALFESTNAPSSHFVLVRGNYAKTGAEVQPGVPAVMSSERNSYCANPTTSRASGRRLALARWLTSPDNPLVARLMVNRIWQYHFGIGLVATPDNFGVTGSKPSHPELLDFLTSEFIRSGWKLKPLHRLILNSATYRQSSASASSLSVLNDESGGPLTTNGQRFSLSPRERAGVRGNRASTNQSGLESKVLFRESVGVRVPPTNDSRIEPLNRPAGLPLPKGEGRGEGEGSALKYRGLESKVRFIGRGENVPRSDAAQRVDPDNRWLWRFPMQRLDSESIRDAMLTVTGELDARLGGPFVAKDKTEEGQYVIVETKPDARRRSLYLQQRRTNPVTFVDLFDGAKMSPNCVQRTSSTVALQSLALLNSEFIRSRSKAFAARLMRETSSPDERITLAFRLAIGRAPTSEEREAANDFLRAETESTDERARWTNFCQMIFASNTFLFVE